MSQFCRVVNHASNDETSVADNYMPLIIMRMHAQLVAMNYVGLFALERYL